MKLTILLTVLTTAALTACNPISRRQMGGITICNGAGATGNCSYGVYGLDTCVNMTAQYYEDAATFAPDDDLFYCYPYIEACGGICTSPEGCTKGAMSFNSTDKYNLTGGWDHLISSFECHAGAAPTTTP